jgi:hypothetical protein
MSPATGPRNLPYAPRLRAIEDRRSRGEAACAECRRCIPWLRRSRWRLTASKQAQTKMQPHDPVQLVRCAYVSALSPTRSAKPGATETRLRRALSKRYIWRNM